MNKLALNELLDGAKRLADASSACPEIKSAACKFIRAFGTNEEDTALKNLLSEVKEDIVPIDNLIDFLKSDVGRGYFGEENARNMLERAEVRKSQGEEFCDCPACSACKDILDTINQ